MEEFHVDGDGDGDSTHGSDIAPALISVHPDQRSVAVAVGSALRIFDLLKGCKVSLCDDSVDPFHKDSIRALRYACGGKLLVSGGDDKLVKIWSTDSWRCILSMRSEKRVSAVAVSSDGLHICFADKFGVVWVAGLDGNTENGLLSDKKAVPLLGHYCSIITSLEFSPNDEFIVSADRDFKIRVTVFPKNPLEGAHEIQSFCLGHTEFVSSLSFFTSCESLSFLVSGSGDSTVRLWDVIYGSLLDTCYVGEAKILERNGNENDSTAVTDVCALPQVHLVAVAVQSFQGIILLSCNFTSPSLQVVRRVSIPGEKFIPTRLSATSGDLLWMVTGISKLNGFGDTSFARLKILSGLKQSILQSDQCALTVLEDDEVPGAEKLLTEMQGSTSIDAVVFCETAKAVQAAMSNLFVKKQYSFEKREYRKRTRNDKKRQEL